MAKKEEYIRDFQGTILGIIRYEENGDKVAMSFPGMQILGYYKAQYNHTTDFYGRILYQGDSVVSFITEGKGR